MLPQPMCGKTSCSVTLFSKIARTNDITVSECTNHNNMFVPLKTTDSSSINPRIAAEVISLQEQALYSGGSN